MRPDRLSSLATMYVQVPVSAKEAGLPIDPTGDAVTMAFTRGADPESGDWKTASWDTDPTTTPDTYLAQCLVGPSGAVTLGRGLWDVWVKVIDSPEVVIVPAGQLEVS